jgi:hypothetical protein
VNAVTDRVKIEVYLPREFVIPVRDALHAVGAGRVGQYDHCVSVTEVSGYWRPLDGAHPYAGARGEISAGMECKLEVLCPAPLALDAVRAIRRVHPYEEPIVNVIPLLTLE